MDQRLKRKIEKRRRQQICEALDLCLQINGIQTSKRELTEDHPTVFLNFSGHVALVEAQVYRSGWGYENAVDRDSVEAYITRPDELREMIGQLKQLKKDLHSDNCDGSRN